MNDHVAEVVRLDFPATYTYLKLISASIAEMFGRAENIPDQPRVLYKIQTAAHEACSNIVDHAYGGRRDGRIAITLTLTEQPRQFIIELHDTGRSFDLASVPAPDLDQAQEHGYGLFLIHSFMDEVTYSARDQDNHWRLVKYL